MAGVQFVQQLDLNGNKITELATGVAGTDAVNVDQLAAAGPQGFAASVGNGLGTSFAVTHGLNTLDVIVQVFDNATGAESIATVVRTSVNVVTVGFVLPPTTNQYRVVVVPVP